MIVNLSNTSQGMEIAKATLPSIITVIGWIIIFQQAMNIRYSEDVKNVVEKSNNVIDRIYDLAFEYYGENIEHIGLKSADIRANFLLLSHYLLLLREKGIQTGLSSYLTAYKKAVMGDYFETTEFKKQLEIPDRRSDIANGRSELSFRISQTYYTWSKRVGFFALLKMRYARNKSLLQQGVSA